ncbi:Domain of unknown function (DUF303) [Seminavis robusta]|uniref:Sialate O-acetylesterase domain-containing protein n=1 Tax=Seminavis robusta TaxID=568900 RepID=A0A9N8E5V3_9STRA|nr:Domain of unknown function (DUF303) [Seminavis robusta]|eukprot:Sro573_g169070.1 Domain of unknown function (DUF303) (372) ;mRNA; r:42830-43945
MESLPVKVYILAGQSNMQGQAQLSTLPYLAMDPQTADLLPKIQTVKDGTTLFRTLDNVWISAIGFDRADDQEERHGKLSVGFGANRQKLGPELFFGVRMQELLAVADNKQQQQQPILLIKTAWGGKSLHTDFRPPSSVTQQEQQAGKYYNMMIAHVRRVLDDISRIIPTYNPQQGYHLAGFVWFQGWNDVVDRTVYPNRHKPGGYDEYGRLLSLFIQDVRNDLDTPSLPFVIGVMGVHGASIDDNHLHARFRRAMEIPLKDQNMKRVIAVRTEVFWDEEIAALDGKWGEAQDKIRQWQQNNKELCETMSQEEQQQTMDALKDETISPEELQLLSMAKSNAGYHYFGSAKFFCRVGIAFAEALVREEDEEKS